ncbi:GGDEF domain-containing protein [Alteromonas gracilis]|uniref:GGDEF domain-containing protein n=1 Tax=Alteromonas gracilis TaxID=1479524 RepID=UPI0030D03EFA
MKSSKSLESFYEEIVRKANDAVVIADSNSHIVFWNLAATRMFGFTEENALGCDMHDLITPPEFRERAKAAYINYVATGEGQLIDSTKLVPAVKENGERIYVELSISRLQTEGSFWAFAFLRNATDRVERERLLEKQALKDPLTQLSNRRCFQQFVESINISDFVVCLIDVDNFKTLNDKFGHDVGDEILISFSKLLSSETKNAKHIARMGGEEFAIVANQNDFGHLIRELKYINQYCQSGELDVPEFSFSCGVCNAAEFSSIRDTLSEADKQLYKAKSGGRKAIYYKSKAL